MQPPATGKLVRGLEFGCPPETFHTHTAAQTLAELLQLGIHSSRALQEVTVPKWCVYCSIVANRILLMSLTRETVRCWKKQYLEN
jgi:hypothetical protein